MDKLTFIRTKKIAKTKIIFFQSVLFIDVFVLYFKQTAYYPVYVCIYKSELDTLNVCFRLFKETKVL